ncbi:inositol monophosphatase family protein [Nocardia donostiensis]|uniref:Inositol-1-monophosphatase n=1 Tax=Nocardia donostiensis TaxID=1538463 RepID=A0A1W0BNZ3_9NOCA|nr:inositol monophosphatase family protein [Nocardia donostiensis]ONM47617.1 inositol monophosphatase [Nocardia donostiensis]OQS24211.1 inositol monophosphatase [Nocardia donostiensis]
MIDTRALLNTARAAVAEGAALLGSSGPGEIHAKGERDFVTELDIEIQTAMQKQLHSVTPWIGFLGEEASTTATDREDAEYVWTLDPIDGTSNFIHGLPLCAVSLALVHRGKPMIGVIQAPFLSLEYYAAEGSGAFCNGEPIAAGRAQNLRDAIVSIGDYAVGPRAAERNRRRFAITEALAATVERVRMFGSAALDLVWVAEGRTDGCVMLSNKPWDTAAGVLIARESGAVVTDSDGSPHSLRARHTIAANPVISRELVRVVSTACEPPSF